MAYQQRPNNGSLFRNLEKKNELSPDFTGTANQVCPHCGAQHETRLAGWVRESRKGVKFLSLKLGERNNPSHTDQTDGDDDIRF